MTLWKFLSKQSDVSTKKIIAIAGISGLSNAALLAIVNSAAHNVAKDGASARLFILFGIAITLYIVTQRYILMVAGVQVERIIEKLRVRLADKIRNSDLQSLEGIGRSEIYASVNRETQTISQAASPLIFACQGTILVFFSLTYILYLSPIAFILTLIIAGAGLSVHFARRKELVVDLQRSTAQENEFFTALTHLIDGFKEVKLSEQRSRGVFDHLSNIAASVTELKSKTAMRFADYYIFSQVIFYLLIGSMVFILPRFATAYSQQITEITAAILFIIGPLTMVVGSIPVVSTANGSVANITRLEDQLDRAQKAAQAREGEAFENLQNFATIELDNIEFQYFDPEGKPSFKVGPANLTIRRGETLFIVGGNGSGKSTFLKVLTALYYPSSGVIRVDGVGVAALGYRSYRSLFSAIFSDYHLFDRLYGMDVDTKRVHELLREMELDKKTTFQEGRFENQDLSTGQRKRLALIVALLEDRPIYVFDEWAADQDPTFRENFYTRRLAELKERGRTVIAATHDDRYFHVADRVVKIDEGRIASIKPKKNKKA